MNCPNKLRECPHGWTDCSLCANFTACQSGTYIPEPEPTPEPEPVPELSGEELSSDLSIPIPRERGTWSEQFANMTEDERWAELYRYHPDNLISKEPYKAMAGAIVPGGGGSVKAKKSKKGNKPTVYVWGENS